MSHLILSIEYPQHRIMIFLESLDKEFATTAIPASALKSISVFLWFFLTRCFSELNTSSIGAYSGV